MKRLVCLVICLCSLFAGVAHAEEKGESIYVKLYGSLVNQYYFRGLRQGSKGVVMQGGADMRVALYDEDDFKFQTITAAFVSLHPGDQRNGDTIMSSMLEMRASAGLGALTRYLEINGLFYMYASPNGSFRDVYELDLYGRMMDDHFWADGDDDAWFRGFFPAITLAQEVSGSRDGRNPGTYLELQTVPTLRGLHGAILAIDFKFPITLGMSLNDYYQIPTRTPGKIQNSFLGFASMGCHIDFDSRWVPERLGGWHGLIGADVLFPKAQKDANVPHVDTAEFIVSGDLVLDF